LAPQLQPSVNLSLEQSGFLFAGDLSTQPIKQTTSTTTASATQPPTTQPEGQQSEALKAAAAALSDSTAAAKGSAGTTEPQGTGRQVAAGTVEGSGQEGRSTVTTMSSSQATQNFSESEARAQSETADKLGLGNRNAAPPTPSQIQGMLQKVMQSLRGQPQTSR
jgi:hypothetical protein